MAQGDIKALQEDTGAYQEITLAVSTVEIGGEGTTPPSTSAGGLFTGATIPLTYKDNTTVYENEYNYESSTHNITIAGLDGRATITGNGTKSVTVAFDVTSATSSLKNFTITCVKDSQSLVYNGMHAHYGTTVTGILTLAYKNITKDGTEGVIGTNYIFIETTSTTLPLFTTNTTLWNSIYSYQVLNVLLANYSSTSIGDNFLYYCYSFNQPLTIPSTVTSIGAYFVSYCYAFNQPLDISGVTSIGDSFLSSCNSFNQPLDISGLTSIGTYFLSFCSSFNQPLTIPSTVTSIGNYFLYYCYSFNQPLTIPSTVTSSGTYFLAYCYAFNQPLDISGLTSISDYFLRFCYSFNQPLTIPSTVTSIGAYFLSFCRTFNQPLDISGLTSIGTYFLYYCWSFNQPLTIPSTVTSIGAYFLYYCHSFNQPLTIPSTVTSIGNYFLYYCYSLSVINYNSSVYPTDNNSLSQNVNSKTSSSGSGIIVYGTNRAGLIAALPDSTVSPFRKLINGGS